MVFVPIIFCIPKDLGSTMTAISEVEHGSPFFNTAWEHYALI